MAMDDWISFAAPLEIMPWGRNVYTVMMLPPELSKAAAERRTRRLEGTMNGLSVNLGINRADVTANAFVYAGKSLQRRLGVRAGGLVDCRLRPADPDEVPIPGDVAEALAAGGRRAAFERLRPARRRQLLAAVEATTSQASRASRVDELVRSLPPA